MMFNNTATAAARRSPSMEIGTAPNASGLEMPGMPESRFWNFVRTLTVDTVRAIQRARRVAGARRHLRDLPDYILSDLGISRSEIDFATADENGGRARRVGRHGGEYR